jgi:hypothetical protein
MLSKPIRCRPQERAGRYLEIDPLDPTPGAPVRAEDLRFFYAHLEACDAEVLELMRVYLIT